jgi:hypothetical protein
MKTLSHLWQYLPQFFLEWEMFQIKVVHNIKTHILCSVTFTRKSFRIWDNVEKYGGAREAANKIMHERWMLDKQGCTHTPAHPHPHAYTCTQPSARTHTRTQKLVIFIAFPRQQWFRKRFSVLRNIYKVVQIWPGQAVTFLHTNSPGLI